MKKLDIATTTRETGSNYPAPFDAPVAAQVCQRLARAGGLTQFGVNLTRLKPGVWSSQRHWHSHEDEMVFVVAVARCPRSSPTRARNSCGRASVPRSRRATRTATT